MTGMLDLRCGADDSVGLQAEIGRRDKIIQSLMYQVEHNLNARDTDYGLLQLTCMLEDQVHRRTEELKRTLDELDQARRETEAARQRLEAAVESSSEGFALFDAEDRLLLCNQAFRRLWGLSGAIVGHGFEALLAEAARSLGGDDPQWQEQCLAAHRAGEGACEFALPGASYVQVRERKTADGYTVGIYSDITDVKAYEERLRRQALAAKSRLLQSTLDAIVQGIAVFDRGLELVAWNPRFFELHGLPDALAKAGVGLQEFLAQDTWLVSMAGASDALALSSSEAFERELPSGRVLELQRSPMPDGGFVITAMDATERRRIEREVLELLQHQQLIFDNASVGIAFLQEWRILSCNQRMAEIFGFASPEAMIGRSIEMLYPSLTVWQKDGALRDAELRSKRFSDDEIELCRQDGTTVWCHRTGRPLDPERPMRGSVWVFTDVTAQRRAASSLHLAAMVFDNSTEALMVTDADNRIVSVNRAFVRITGYSAEDVIGKEPRILKSGTHDADFYRQMWECLLGDGRWEGEVIDRRKDGRLYPKWLTISVVRNEIGTITNYVAAFSDITARKAAEDRISFLAHHDSLTGLPNRVLLRDRFERLVRQARRQDSILGVCFLDFDHFKRVNDTLGHRIGDQLIVEVARRLCECLRQTDTVSRLGGDEFILLLEGQMSTGQFIGVVEKLLASLEAPYEIGPHLLATSASIGIAVFPNDGEDFDTLLQKADTAMYHVKGQGRGTFGFFDERMNRDAASRLDRATRLRHALARKEFHLVFQPQFALPARQLVGVEALLRWNSAPHGEESPDLFIPIAEETGQILPIGTWVLHEGCRLAQRWREQGTLLRMAINVSAVQIYRHDFAPVLRQVLDDTGVDPAQIELELTESTIMADTQLIREVFEEVRAMGVSVAIDDFGTGYSSLAYLRRFHVRKLKVDKSFVQDLPHDDEAKAIAEAIVRMAQSLRLRVNAEGVETAEQLDFLAAIGCDEVQGYFVGKPASAEGIMRLFGSRGAW